MVRLAVLAGIGVLALSTNGMAQDHGGVRLSPGINGGPVGLAKPLLSAPMPYMTARDVQNGMTASDHQAQNQAMISRLRGDPGYLAGFSQGTPLAASRQVQVAPDQSGYGYDYGGQSGHHRHRQAPIIINNEGPLAVTVGNGNVVQQQSSNGSGPTALQQVATTPSAGSSSGATNLVTGGGNIVQRAPGHF
jgi:hypothetical protein